MSVTYDSKYLHVTEGLSLDIMHNVLEGCLQYETKELLKYLLLQKNLFSLNHLNNRIDYSYFDATDKPVAIAMNSLLAPDHALKQRGQFSLL